MFLKALIFLFLMSKLTEFGVLAESAKVLVWSDTCCRFVQLCSNNRRDVSINFFLNWILGWLIVILFLNIKWIHSNSFSINLYVHFDVETLSWCQILSYKITTIGKSFNVLLQRGTIYSVSCHLALLHFPPITPRVNLSVYHKD